jgi:hypothetical protein
MEQTTARERRFAELDDLVITWADDEWKFVFYQLMKKYRKEILDAMVHQKIDSATSAFVYRGMDDCARACNTMREALEDELFTGQ